MMPKVLGAIAPLFGPPRVLGSYKLATALREVSHHAHLSRVDNQGDKPSCVGWAFANAIMMAEALSYVPVKEISGDKIWAAGRDLFYDGNMDGGLTLQQGWAAAGVLGAYPKGMAAIRVKLTAEAICSALQLGPLVAANNVHEGWENLHPDNDAVDESCPFDGSENGHATCVFAFDRHGGLWMTRHENSWGGGGFVAMTIEHFLATAIDEPYLITGVKK